ncbi:hypothetical protein K474DRAFT_1667932 [Panus rudis PR-1116 ss-1]|nr:hypothetical protein K474DRAFT_1667932 [Panus rudis PR-1116 ss-1]
MAQKKQVANSFLSSLDSRATQAERMSQGFSDVNNDIRAFVVDFQNMLAGYDLDAMEKRIKELDVEIKKLADDMKELQSTLDSLNKQLESAQSAAAVTGIFGFLCPLFWIGTAISATQISSLKQQLASVRDEYNRKLSDHRNKETERRNLQADIKAIPLLRSAVVKSTPDVDNIRYKIGAFATVWAAIRADTQGILEKLEYATDTASMTLFKLRVQTAADMYKILQATLNDYKEYLDKSREFKEILEKYGIHI